MTGAALISGPRSGLGSVGCACCCCCDQDAPNPNDEGLLWLRADRASADFLTLDGSNRSSLWINQFPPDLDAGSVTETGAPIPVGEWPVWTPSVQNGLGGALWSKAAFTRQQKVYPNPQPPDLPTPNGSGIQALAVVRCTDTNLDGANVVLTFRMNNDDLEFGLRKKNFSGTDYYIPVSTAQDAHGSISIYRDLSNRTLLLEWVYYGHDVFPDFFINGAQETLVAAQLNVYSGVSGYSVGYCNANFSFNWEGYLMEILAYRGTTASTRLAARSYLNNKWRVYS